MNITNRVHAIEIPFEITVPEGTRIMRSVYVYLIVGKRLYLIDSGVKGSEKRIKDYIESIGRRYDEIEMVFLTHSHPDHIGAVAQIREDTGCIVLAHESEKTWIEDIAVQARQRPVPRFFDLVDRSVHVDSFVEDGQILRLESNIALRVFHTPGHSQGSTSLLYEEEGVLFTGDALIARGHMPIYDDCVAMSESIDRLAVLKNVAWIAQAWTAPRSWSTKVFREARSYLSEIDMHLMNIPQHRCGDQMHVCTEIVAKLQLPPYAINPLVARALTSHINNAARQEAATSCRKAG
jgi:hydroxyacylglutathione hydrolase